MQMQKKETIFRDTPPVVLHHRQHLLQIFHHLLIDNHKQGQDQETAMISRGHNYGNITSILIMPVSVFLGTLGTLSQLHL